MRKCNACSSTSLLRRQGGIGRRRAFTISNRQTGGDHVGIADGLHLVDVVALDAGVEQLVDRIEKRHHLARAQLSSVYRLSTYINKHHIPLFRAEWNGMKWQMGIR